MLSLLLSAALLGGLGSSQRMGEVSPFAVIVTYGATLVASSLRKELSWPTHVLPYLIYIIFLYIV